MKINNKKIVLILGIVGLLLLLTGVTFALMSGTLLGVRENVITLNSNLSFTYEEGSNALALDLDSILNDNDGQTQNEYFDFTVSLLGNRSMSNNYLIYITVDEEYSTIANSGVKVYLTDQDDNAIISARNIGSLEQHMEYASSYKLYQTSITSSGNVRTTDEYRIRVWIDSGYLVNINETDGVHEVTIEDATYKFTVNVEAYGENLDKSGANEPDLATGMIPVYYDSINDVWKKADQYNANQEYRWYSYSSSGATKGMWANAVTVDVSNATIKDKYFNTDMSIKVTNGTEISMSDINTMWVWIPRFDVNTGELTTQVYFENISGEITGKCSDDVSSNEDNCISHGYKWYNNHLTPGAININFVNTSVAALDAFTFDEAKSGFWYGKFETSHSTLTSSTTANNLGCGTEICSKANGIKIKPNVIALRYNNLKNFFYAARSMEQTNNSFGFVTSEVDTHLSKNNEWGAVAYLTQSIYGRCSNNTTCDEVTINNCETYITGIGGDAESAGESSAVCTIAANQYNGAKGVLASTTGTIYGIYDMSGGLKDYVMGNYNSVSASSGITMSSILAKYVNVYTGTSYIGHALTEVAEWYSDYAYFVNSSDSWFTRGHAYDKTSKSGIFSYYYCDGSANGSYGSRFALVK